jgi:hypothetical protein
LKKPKNNKTTTNESLTIIPPETQWDTSHWAIAELHFQLPHAGST